MVRTLRRRREVARLPASPERHFRLGHVSNRLERNSLSGKFRPARMAQRLGRCLNEGSGETVVSVKMPSTRGWTERPREPLLQLDIGVWGTLSRIGGRL
jgi:hypothetical protein